MISKRAKCAIFLFILLVYVSPIQGAEIYRIDLAHGGRWHDAEKSKGERNDDWLCWAATAANVLAWSGWGRVAGFKDEDDIFHHYTRNWSDDPAGSPREAWRWWFTGEARGGGAKPLTDSAGYWPNVKFPEKKWGHGRKSFFRGVGQYQLKRDPYLLQQLLQDGYGVVIQIIRYLEDGERDSHMITLWGYRSTQERPFHSILITDSDDAKDAAWGDKAENKLVEYPVELQEGVWKFTYKNKRWRILAAYGLRKKE